MRCLLDTNAVVALLGSRLSPIARRVRQENPDDVAISAIVAHELYDGAFKSRQSSRNLTLVDQLQFPIVEFTREDARRAGEIRALMAIRGTAIGPYDVLIAGQAAARDLVLVTHNTRKFARVPGLRIEDWEG